MFETKAKASSLRGQGQFSSRPRPRPVSSRPKPRQVIMIVEKNYISHQNSIFKLTAKRNKTFIKAQVVHKIEPQSSPHCIKVLQIEHVNYRPVTGGRCIEAKARTVRGQGQSQDHDFGSSSCPRARGQSSRTPSRQWRTNRKSYMVYRTAPFSMTVNNP